MKLLKNAALIVFSALVASAATYYLTSESTNIKLSKENMRPIVSEYMAKNVCESFLISEIRANDAKDDLTILSTVGVGFSHNEFYCAIIGNHEYYEYEDLKTTLRREYFFSLNDKNTLTLTEISESEVLTAFERYKKSVKLNQSDS